MQIKIKTLTGRIIPLEVECGDSILSICKKLENKVGVLADQMRLVYQHVQLNYYHMDPQLHKKMEKLITNNTIEYKKKHKFPELIKCDICKKIGCNEENTLADYNIGADSEIYLILMLRGC